MAFNHFHVHTEYSLLDGLSRMNELVAGAYADGSDAVAATDHGTPGGSFKLRQACLDLAADLRASGEIGPDDPLPIKPVYGIEAYMAIGSRHERNFTMVPRDEADADNYEDAKSASTKKKTYDHLTLLAISETGWANLMHLHRKSYDTTWGKYPRMDYELLAEHCEGIVCLTGCLAGPVAGPLHRGDAETAGDNLDRLIGIFGLDNTYVEIMDHDIESETAITPELVELARSRSAKIIATNDCHFTHEDDARVHEAWLAVQSGSTLDDESRFKFNGSGYYLKNEDEMRAIRAEEWWAEACDTTEELAARIPGDVMPKPIKHLPQFPVPDDFDIPAKRQGAKKTLFATGEVVPWTRADQMLFSMVLDGARSRYADPIPSEVRERIRSEFSVISSMGFSDYFLIVDDIVTWARSQGIAVGPGRGSAAGCLCAYAMKIVNVEPLANHLLFERFLEPGRTDYPDMDIDFEKRRRDEVIAYIASRWGAEMVAKIGTYGQSRAKDAFQKAVKVLGRPELTSLSKSIPVAGGKPMELGRVFDPEVGEAAEFRRAFRSEVGDDEYEQIESLARGFEGAKWSKGIHACGIVISDQPLTGLIPLRVDTKSADNADRAGYAVTEWEGPELEAFGMLKMDVLGLNNLDILVTAAVAVREQTGETIDLLEDIPDPNDTDNPRVSRVWSLISAGETAGLFQLESSGMADVCKRVAPHSLEELSAVIALFRPGPISAGMPDLYADRKWGRKDIDYNLYTDDADEQAIIHSVLGETQGCIVYQEQLMRLGTAVAGFDAAWRSKLRKAVGKKKKALMDQVGTKFIADAQVAMTLPDGGEKPAFKASTAERLWEDFKGSADYLFNASHSYAYAQLAYMCAYFKANWPGMYGAALLAMTDKDKAERRAAAIVSLMQEGIDVVRPDINSSGQQTVALSDKRIIIGLAEVKGCGEPVAAIIAERQAHGPFISFGDFITRCDQQVNAGVLESLIQAGAFDEFGPRKALMRVARAVRKNPDIIIGDEEYPIIERAKREREKVGFVVAESHPMRVLHDDITAWKAANGGERGFAGLPKLLSSGDGDPATAIGLLSEWKMQWNKAGTSQYVRFTIEDGQASISGIAFSSTLADLSRMRANIEPGDLVKISGRVQVREREVTEDETGADDVVYEIKREIIGNDILPIDLGNTPEPPPERVDLSALWALLGASDLAGTSAAGDDAESTEAPARAGGDDDSGDPDDEWPDDVPVSTPVETDEWPEADEPAEAAEPEPKPEKHPAPVARMPEPSVTEVEEWTRKRALEAVAAIPSDSCALFLTADRFDDLSSSMRFFIHDGDDLRQSSNPKLLGIPQGPLRQLRFSDDLQPGFYAMPQTSNYGELNLVMVVFGPDFQWPDADIAPEELTYARVESDSETIFEYGMSVRRMRTHPTDQTADHTRELVSTS